MLGAMTTPQTRFGLLSIGTVALLAIIPAMYFQGELEYTRDDLLPMTDTGRGSFLIFGVPFFLVVWIVMIILGRFILREARFPANLWNWDSEHSRRSLVCSIFYATIVVLLSLATLWSTVNFPLMLPSSLIGIYVMLSMRAALLNRWSARDLNGAADVRQVDSM
jgi:hypothetical protein